MRATCNIKSDDFKVTDIVDIKTDGNTIKITIPSEPKGFKAARLRRQSGLQTNHKDLVSVEDLDTLVIDRSGLPYYPYRAVLNLFQSSVDLINESHLCALFVICEISPFITKFEQRKASFSVETGPTGPLKSIMMKVSCNKTIKDIADLQKLVVSPLNEKFGKNTFTDLVMDFGKAKDGNWYINLNPQVVESLQVETKKKCMKPV